jgi:hypothetical protein
VKLDLVSDMASAEEAFTACKIAQLQHRTFYSLPMQLSLVPVGLGRFMKEKLGRF